MLFLDDSLVLGDLTNVQGKMCARAVQGSLELGAVVDDEYFHLDLQGEWDTRWYYFEVLKGRQCVLLDSLRNWYTVCHVGQPRWPQLRSELDS